MTNTALAELYRAYIACLNRQDWANLHRFVAGDARHNGWPFGLAGYRAMLERDFEAIPDLQFNVELLICEPPHVASRLRFDCRPNGLFLNLPVNGRRVACAENVFYRFRDERVAEVWSVIDKAAIEAQLVTATRPAGSAGSCLAALAALARPGRQTKYSNIPKFMVLDGDARPGHLWNSHLDSVDLSHGRTGSASFPGPRRAKGRANFFSSEIRS